MNLVGHVAVAVRSDPDAAPGLLAGAMLPDLAAIARIRLVASAPATPADDAMRGLTDGIALHHASDAVFHASSWFHRHNQGLRDALLDAGIDRGAARACAHAGLEMLLDGRLVEDHAVVGATDSAFDALSTSGAARAAAAAAVAPGDAAIWLDRLDQLGRSLDPRSYRSAMNVAHRLHRMTRGRARIELRAEHVARVADALGAYRPVVAHDSERVVDDVIQGLAADREANFDHAAGAGRP
jgi:hypothetical protein